MKRWHAALAAAAVIALIFCVTSVTVRAKVKAQLDVAAGPHGDTGDWEAGPVVRPAVRHGTVPDKWQPHIPARAHMGRHRMYSHPASCSPNLNAPTQMSYDWMFCPPSEGDL